MKMRFFVAVLVTFQTLWFPSSLSAMQEDISAHLQSQEPRKLRLKNALEQIFGVEVLIDDQGEVVFKGSSDQLSKTTAKLNDFNLLRQDVIPVSPNRVTTQVCHTSHFTCWDDFLISVGLQPEKSNALNNISDIENSLQLDYERETINQSLADAYVELLKKRSETFNWLSLHHRGLIQYGPMHLTINYGLMASYFCSVELPQELTEESGIFTSSMSLNHVLQRLTAAAGGDISLVRSNSPGHYHVRTVLPGNKGRYANDGPPPTVEFVIDRSGSMRDNPINTINRTMPKLLLQLRESLQVGESLIVKVFAFNDEVSELQTYMLSHGSHSKLIWNDIVSDGGTDLTHVGNRMRLSTPDERRVVIGFTDGCHESSKSDIHESFRKLRELQHQGSFAQPYLCRIGAGGARSDEYFSNISKIFAGSFCEDDSIGGFCEKVSRAIPELLVSTEPLVLTIGGLDVTLRLKDANPDIHTTIQTLTEGDSAVFQGVRRTINHSAPLLAPVAPETKKEKRERLLAELAALDSDSSSDGI